MVHEGLERALSREGYRYCTAKQRGVTIFYRYGQGVFYVMVAVDLRNGEQLAPGQLSGFTEQVRRLFFKPQEWLPDFPEETPVSEVRLFTLLLGGEDEQERGQIRILCSACEDVWAYLTAERRLVIYENQPGDFWGMKQILDNMEGEASVSSLMERARELFGGWLPGITIGIAAANVLVFLILEIMGDTQDALFVAGHGGLYPDFILYGHQWWRILTASFIHFGAAHLLNNMVIFCSVGWRLERAVGHIKLLVIYFLSAIGGGLLSYYMMLRTGDFAVSAGASGAVFGIIAGLLFQVILHKGRLGDMTTRGLLIMLALCTYYGFSTIDVDNWCHIGGAVTGFVSTAILSIPKKAAGIS